MSYDVRPCYINVKEITNNDFGCVRR